MRKKVKQMKRKNEYCQRFTDGAVNEMLAAFVFTFYLFLHFVSYTS